MEKDHQLFLNTRRLILRFPHEADSGKFQAFDERNKAHMSPWRSSVGVPEIDHKTQLIKWKDEFEAGRSIRFLLFLKGNPEGEIIGFCNFSQIFRGPFQACY